MTTRFGTDTKRNVFALVDTMRSAEDAYGTARTTRSGASTKENASVDRV
jgi:hypothetical protein